MKSRKQRAESRNAFRALLCFLLSAFCFAAHAGEIRNAARDAKSLATAPLHWRSAEWRRLGAGVAAVAIVGALDKPIMDVVQRNRSSATESFSKAITPFGGGRMLQISALMFAGGALMHDKRLEAAGRDAVISELWSAGLVTPLIKRIVGRSRPFLDEGTHSFHPFSGKSHESFPSGHATNAFAAATAIASHYQSTAARVIVYSMATGVAYSRVHDNVHWPSDVLAGALIGRAVAKSVAFRHANVRISFEFVPKDASRRAGRVTLKDARSSRAFRPPSPGAPFASLSASLR
jgi:membrane-associated phospholipid phosphatase